MTPVMATATPSSKAATTTTRFTSPSARQTPQALLPKLRKLDAGFRARWLVLMVVGAAVSMIGPVLIATWLWLREFRSGGVGIGDVQHSFAWHLGVASACFLPVLFAVEWLSRGRLVDDAFEDTKDDGADWAGRVVAGAAILDMCLWGPRMVTGGARRLLGLRRHRAADRALAAAMLAELFNRGQGMPVAELFTLAKDRDEAFSAALAYLMFHDLIDISKNGDRAWVVSEAKRTLGV